ncbi:expressed conserved protein [Echinococcus multilocularis]|uniref:Expressed conserved protein n=1 Tax=Echinococcus multilocularis TaxID=6211 RepID=A0A068Y2A0_ECHMU|nr:expressed conserved protein [Echinococcus multilocularis]
MSSSVFSEVLGRYKLVVDSYLVVLNLTHIMVRIANEGAVPFNAEPTSPILLQRKKKVRLAAFTSSVSLILSWPFPLIILCFQANRRLNFDPRIYTTLMTAYLLSGSIKRLLLRRFLSPSFFNAIAPAVLGLVGNGVFMTALYKSDNWNGLSIFFMLGSRLLFGWSTYSAEDYNRRAKNVIKIEREVGIISKRVADMVPDLQDSTFHAGVIVAIVICFILEVCLRFVGPEMTEFYSLLILSGFSTCLSLISVPSLHIAVRSLLNVPAECEGSEQCLSSSRTCLASSNGGDSCAAGDVGGHNRMVSRALTIRNKYIISTVFVSLKHHQYPPGQLIMILFSGLLTTGTIFFDYLLLPYFVVYLQRNLFTPFPDFFPFPDFILVYGTLFASELLSRTIILEYTNLGDRIIKWSNHSLIGALIVVSALSFFMPAILYWIGSRTAGAANSLFGFCLFVLCVTQGLLKAAHALLGGLLFTKYCDSMTLVPRSVAQTGEQLLGVVRCFFAALLFAVGGAILYHQRFMATMVTVSVVYSLALSTAIAGYARVYAHDKASQVRIEHPD